MLADSDVELFKRYKISGVQINLLLNSGLSAIVRINIDKENIARVDELLDTLGERIDKRDELKIDFGQVLPFTEICKSIESDCYNNEQFADVMLPLYEKVLAHGFTMNKMAAYPAPRLNFCCADYVNAFVVDNRGELYRCWNHVGNLISPFAAQSTLKAAVHTPTRRANVIALSVSAKCPTTNIYNR